MTVRAELLASLPVGPRRPVGGSPSRRPDSVRRTTSIEEQWADFGRPRTVRAHGRDLLTRADGTWEVCDAAVLQLGADGAGNVTTVVTEPHVPALDRVVGTGTRSGFRAAVAAAAPTEVARGGVLHQLLDDVPLAALIASYGLTREHPEWNIPPEATARLRNLCAGWEEDATMMGALDRTGVFPIPEGPPAPPLVRDDDPLGWHELAPLAPRTVRRVRRLDLWRRTGDLEAEAYFRDSHLGTRGPEDVLHEYTVTLTLAEEAEGPDGLRVTSVAATAHTLPWPECPTAVASAQRVVGERVVDLPELVGAELTGTTTCTHLNDVLRSVGGLATMVAWLPAAGAGTPTEETAR